MFDDVISDMESNKKRKPKVTELFLRGRKLNIPLDVISQSYFKVLKTKRINATRYFVMKISNNKELQEIASNHSSTYILNISSSFIAIMIKNRIHF